MRVAAGRRRHHRAARRYVSDAQHASGVVPHERSVPLTPTPVDGVTYDAVITQSASPDDMLPRRPPRPSASCRPNAATLRRRHRLWLVRPRRPTLLSEAPPPTSRSFDAPCWRGVMPPERHNSPTLGAQEPFQAQPAGRMPLPQCRNHLTPTPTGGVMSSLPPSSHNASIWQLCVRPGTH